MLENLINSSHYGKLIMLTGLLVGVPILILPFYPEEVKYIPAFLIPMLISLGIGLIICMVTYKEKKEETDWQTSIHNGNIVTLFVWSYSFLLGAIPFVLADQLDFVKALFESVSGWTTTGLSVVDVSIMPKIFLFHRSFMQYCGGLGFVLMMVIVIQGKQANTLYNAEGHLDRLKPSLKKTARVTFLIYGGCLVIGVVLYCIFGMGIFDAVCHTMSALSTAGFTTKVNSIGEYASFPIEIITIVLMLIGASNFGVLFMIFDKKVLQLFRVTEVRVMIGLMLSFVPLSAYSLYTDMDMSAFESFRHALFGVVTVFSTTGYSIMNYAIWPPFAMGLLILLMFIGGSSGSTAGGIKLSRTYLLLRITYENIRKRMSPAIKTASPSYYTARGKMPIDSSLVADTFGFIACYVGIFVIGSLLLTITADCSLLDAIFEFASAFGTVGISNGMTNANTNNATLIVEMVGMALGRLEMFVLFFGLISCVQIVKEKLSKIN